MASDQTQSWQLQEAKARFSDVVRRALDEGPQHITVRGKAAAVLLSEIEYRRLKRKRPSIVDYLLAGEPWPDDVVEAINDRSGQADRDIEF